MTRHEAMAFLKRLQPHDKFHDWGAHDDASHGREDNTLETGHVEACEACQAIEAISVAFAGLRMWEETHGA